ncbi:MAG: diphosphate--fructose-6-phosphate 1-phosphotransferase [Spirochaetaceae bacterium]|jgi:pyrophosphate--fructose-6-phosphate 1-phosphotransferase|nr:diphosphate--fructose-6-phosphate 1-phosphotransferase [Spirochaetaceae bacterium]
MEASYLQRARYAYAPKLPACLAGEISNIKVEFGEPTSSASDTESLKAVFKHSFGKPIASFRKGEGSLSARALSVGVILSGGQAPGGHNVIAGLYDGLKRGNPRSTLLGFLGGPSGLIDNAYVELDDETVDRYRNTGGFDMIGSGRDKIESQAQFAAALESAKLHRLSAVVVVGGDDSNTNAALLAEYFLDKGAPISVIGCPKTIDGDLKNEYIETSFGFDTAVKTYSELIGNIMNDASSAKKYWHFIKLMGRSASHIALEAALQTHPNLCLISEEVEDRQLSLNHIIEEICEAVVRRAQNGQDFGVVLIPEGVVEFVPEMKKLISELNDIMAAHGEEFEGLRSFDAQGAFLERTLSRASIALFEAMPEEISKQLLLDRDAHGNVQVSRIETEKLLISLVEKKLGKMKAQGTYRGKFSPLGHFFGYEGRSAFPSNFDADYCYSLGFCAFALIAAGLTGYVSFIRNLTAGAGAWQAGGAPLTMMMHLEKRQGKSKPVIRKALVDLKGKPFAAFAKERARWAVGTHYVNPGAIQYFGPPEVCERTTITLQLEREP